MTRRQSPARTAAHAEGRRAMQRWLPWLAPLLVALAVRLLVWSILPYHLPNLVPISDEGEYRAAAIWLANGRNFSFFRDWIWTRPPLYILFLALQIKLFGPLNLVPLRLSQALLSTVTVGLVMAWARRLAPPASARSVALLTGWMMALCYSLASFSYFVLSETLFMTLLFGALLTLTIWAQAGGWRWLIIAGLLLGLGSLTRAVLAGTLPLIALWVCWIAQRCVAVPQLRQRLIRAVVVPVVLTLVVSAVILPWSIYNTRFFGAKYLILIDTTGGYNAWYGAIRNQDYVHARLIAIPDQSERQNFAYSAAWHVFANNPGSFALKTGHELLDLLLVNFGGVERLTRGYTIGDTPVPHLLGLLEDDLLYVLTAPLAVLGLFRWQGRAGKGLALIWLCYNLVTGPLFFAINRFRLPLLPVLFVYAACGVVQWRAAWKSRMRHTLATLVGGGLGLFLLASLIWDSPPSALNSCTGNVCAITRSIQTRSVATECERAWQVLWQGKVDEAQAIVDRGVARQALPCFALVQARIDQRRGAIEQALGLLHISADEGASVSNARVLMLEGDILRAQGKMTEARERWVPRQVDQPNDLDWAWRYLEPPPTTRIEVGHGLDLGLIDGFGRREHPDDHDPFGSGYRWTEPVAHLKWPQAGTGKSQMLRMEVNGYRPPGEAPTVVTIIQGKVELARKQVPSGWTEVRVTLPPTPAGQDVIVQLDSSFFVPSPGDAPSDQPLRMRGVEMRLAELVNEQG